MRELILHLSKRTRPIFRCDINGEEIKCLFDTGANISVWNGTLLSFKKLFPSSELMLKDYLITGFGGSGEYHDIYKVPIFTVSDYKNKYTVLDLYIAVANKQKYDFRLILSPSIFSKSKIILDYNSRLLTIEYEKDKNYMIASDVAGTQVVMTQDTTNALVKAALLPHSK